MKDRYMLTCSNCSHEFEGRVILDELGWHAVCPSCGSSFDVDLPEKRYVIAIAFMPEDEYDLYFENEFVSTGYTQLYAFPNYKALLRSWKRIAADPPSMWYWVVDVYGENGLTTIVSGAIDPSDDEIIAEYFDEIVD